MRKILFLMIIFGLFSSTVFAATDYGKPWDLDGYEGPTLFGTIVAIVIMIIAAIVSNKNDKNR